jgi:hypothetical protein
MSSSVVRRPARRSVHLFQFLTIGGLVVDAVIHLQLASVYQLAAPAGIGQGNLFRIQAAAALAVAVWVLVRPHRLAFGAAALVAGSALGAVLVYRYVDVGSFGPIPSMYEPLWFAKKTATAIAEAFATVAALIACVGLRQADPIVAPNPI